MTDQDRKHHGPTGAGMGLVFGAGIGMIFGAAFGNPGLGMVLGAGVGLVFGNILKQAGQRQDR